MPGLYERDFSTLTSSEIQEKEKLDAASQQGLPFGRKNCFLDYPKAVRHNESLFPNNYLDIVDLNNTSLLAAQCDGFEELIQNSNTTELNLKTYIQTNRYYHIPAALFRYYDFGHHEAILFKEFALGTSYKADYVLAGRASGGWEFVFVEWENPYNYGNNKVVRNDGTFGETIQKGLRQIDDWKSFIESNYSTISTEFQKYTQKTLPKEFYQYDSSRMHYAVIAGMRSDYQKDNTRIIQRNLLKNQNIKLIHYENLLDAARALIGGTTY